MSLPYEGADQMAKLHTDREILRCIFDMYAAQYPSSGDPYLPIDARAIAARLNCSPELLFGRLYHDMGNRLRYVDGNTRTALFELKVGNQMHCVNFPYLAAVLAEKQSQYKREVWALALSIVAVIVAVASAAVQFATAK